MLEDIVKHLQKKNKGMSENEAKEKARKIWDDYCKKNKVRDQKREKEHKKKYEEALNWESNNTLFEYMDDLDGQ
jgi:hypothetical protein